jgi:hypothetical protein
VGVLVGNLLGCLQWLILRHCEVKNIVNLEERGRPRLDFIRCEQGLVQGICNAAECLKGLHGGDRRVSKKVAVRELNKGLYS